MCARAPETQEPPNRYRGSTGRMLGLPLLYFSCLVGLYMWAVTCNFQKCGILQSVYLDEPVQPPVKLKQLHWMVFSQWLNSQDYSSDNQRLWSNCAYVIFGFAPNLYMWAANDLLWLCTHACLSEHSLIAYLMRNKPAYHPCFNALAQW